MGEGEPQHLSMHGDLGHNFVLGHPCEDGGRRAYRQDIDGRGTHGRLTKWGRHMMGEVHQANIPVVAHREGEGHSHVSGKRKTQT